MLTSDWSPQHPDYSPATTANDVSVLELAAQSADFLTARPNIKPACLPEDGAEFGGQLGALSQSDFMKLLNYSSFLCVPRPPLICHHNLT